MNRVEKIRKRIVLSRTAKGYTQAYMGEQLHISQIAYHKLESGKTALKIKTLLDLATILEVEETYLLGYDD